MLFEKLEIGNSDVEKCVETIREEYSKLQQSILKETSLLIQDSVNDLVMFYSQLSLNRSAILVEGIAFTLENGRTLMAQLGLRALIENVGGLAYLYRRFKSRVEGNIAGDVFNSDIKKLLLGIKEFDIGVQNAPDPINVMNMVDSIDHVTKSVRPKELKFREIYDELSQYSHPNFLAVSANLDIAENKSLKISDNAPEYPIETLLKYLSLTMLTIGFSYQGVIGLVSGKSQT